MSLVTYTPAAADAQGRARTFQNAQEPDFPSANTKFATAKFVYKPVCDEVLRLIQVTQNTLTKTDNYTLTAADNGALVLVNVSTTGKAITLPNPATVGLGWHVTIKKINSSTTNTVSVARNGSETIDGRSAGDVLTAQYSFATYWTDGTNWFVLGAWDRLSVVAGYTALSTSTGQYGDMTSLSVPPGEWAASLIGTWANIASITRTLIGISTTSGNSATGLVDGDNVCETVPPTLSYNNTGVIPRYPLSISATTTHYAKYLANWSGSAPSFKCRFTIERER